MSSGQSQLLSSAVFYAPTPVLTLDTGRRVIDYNIALERWLVPKSAAVAIGPSASSSIS